MQPYYHSLQPVSLTGAQLDHLLSLGWYRMHQNVFTTSHVHLGDVFRVHWLRYAIHELHAHASHKRIRKRMRNFHYRIEDFVLRDEHRELHQRYYSSIDFEGAPSITDCLFGEPNVIPSIFQTKTISVYENSRLIAAGYFDLGETGAASILHFYDPLYKPYSVGKYLLLLTIDYLQEHEYLYYYPGYVVEGNSKMDYKLFLGREQAQYFDPLEVTWKYFQESILHKQSL